MQKSEWLALAPGQVNELLWSLIGGKLADIPCPPKVFPPKFDSRVGRKGGYVWASEMDLESLRFFHGRATASVAAGGSFAEKNAKELKSLDYWVKYRECYPDSAWTGERNRDQVTARHPSGKPEIHIWEPKGGTAPRSTSTAKGYDDEPATGGGYGGGGDDDIPFTRNVCSDVSEAWWGKVGLPCVS